MLAAILVTILMPVLFIFCLVVASSRLTAAERAEALVPARVDPS